MNRDQVLEFSIIGVTAGGAGAAIAIAIASGLKSSDIFAFVGALVGAGATVAGAIWGSDRNARRARLDEQLIVSTELSRLRSLVAKAELFFAAEQAAWPGNWRTSIDEIAAIISEIRTIVQEAMLRALTLDFRQRAKLIQVDRAISWFIDFYGYAYNDYEDDPLDDRTWPATLSTLRKALDDTLAMLPPP